MTVVSGGTSVMGSRRRVSAATLDEHEGVVFREHQFVVALSP
jgi:hypothetical protein